jgi:hypothetical protein
MEVSVGDEKSERRYVVLEDNEVLWFDKPMVKKKKKKKKKKKVTKLFCCFTGQIERQFGFAAMLCDVGYIGKHVGADRRASESERGEQSQNAAARTECR